MRARELREHPGMRGASLGPGAFVGKDVWTPEPARPKPVPVIPARWLRLDDARDGAGGRHVVGLFLLPGDQPIALMLSAAQAAELRDGLTTVLDATAAEDEDPGEGSGSAVPTPGPAPAPPALVLALTADPAAGIGG